MALQKAQIEICQGATFRSTLTITLADFGIPDVGTWATAATFTVSQQLRGDEGFFPVCTGVALVFGNEVTLEIDADITDAITRREGFFTVHVTNGSDVHRVVEGGWLLRRATDGAGQSVVSQAATSPFNSDALLGALTPFRKTPVRVLGYGSGLWTAGTVLAGVNTSPEVLSVLYRTRVNITWTGATVGVMVVSDIVVGSTLGWTARITAINYGAKTAVLSLWTGIAAGAGAETLTSGGNSIAGVSVGAFAGSRTGYQATVTPGVFAPKAPGVAGIYNVVGARQDVTNGSRFPLEPYDYDLSIDLPQWHFAEGAILSIDLWGVLFCTIPAGDTPRIEFALAIGTSIFLEAELDIDRPNWPRFETAQLPSTINVDTPFHAKLRLVNCRRSDRTQQQLGSLQMEAGALSFVATAQAAIELEDGYNLVGKVSRRNVAIMLAVSPQVASANQFYVNVHTWRAELEAND